MNKARIIRGDESNRQDEGAAASDWGVPLRLAAIGLLLMLGGYAAMNYVPLSPSRAEQERQLAELRDLAAKSGTTGEALEERLKQIAPAWGTPPYQLPGRLAVYGGLALFVVAGVRMYRHSTTANTEEETI